MIALVGTLIALAGIALFCGAGVLHERWENSLAAPRRREHRCGACGYSLEGILVDVCPECGADRVRVEPLSQRRRCMIALWMIPALVACLFGLAVTDPKDLAAPAMLGAAFVWAHAVTCRQVAMTPYFGMLAAGLTLISLTGLSGQSRPGEDIWTIIAMITMFLGPVGLAVLHIRRGRLYADRPRKASGRLR